MAAGQAMMTAPPIALMIVGAQKCGTSSLLRYLGQHPDLCAHEQTECAFFVNAEEHAAGWERIAPIYFPLTRAASRRLIAKSASLMCSPAAVERLAAHNPVVQVVVMLRDPVQRAYAAYREARRNGLERLPTFAEAVWADPARLRGNAWRELSCDYLRGSAYVYHLRSLLARFPPERVHAFLTEELRDCPEVICGTLFTALRVPPAERLDLARRHNMAAQARAQWLASIMTAQPSARRALRRVVPIQARKRIRRRLRRMNEVPYDPPPLDPALAAELRDYFRPLNAQLAELLGRDLGHWG